MAEYNWTRFKRSIFIDASPDAVFEAWIQPSQICTWFLKQADYTSKEGSLRCQSDFIATGDSYAWQWWNYATTEHGLIHAVDRDNRTLAFSFAGDCRVIVRVEVIERDTILRLEQSDIPTDEQNKRDIHIGCGQGWSFWMLNLNAWLEHGVTPP